MVIETVPHCSPASGFSFRIVTSFEFVPRAPSNGEDCSTESKSVGDVVRNSFENPMSMLWPLDKVKSNGTTPLGPYPIVRVDPARSGGSTRSIPFVDK